jgi:hypothetical protein
MIAERRASMAKLGRPTTSDRYHGTLNVVIGPELKGGLLEVSARRGKPMTQIVMEAIRRELKRLNR